MQKPALHVVFGMSAAGSIRQALHQIGCDDRVIGFADDLSFGPIDQLEIVSREDWIAEALGYDFGEVCSRVDQFWVEAMSPDVSPMVWVCRGNASEYAGFLEFVFRRVKAPFRIIDASDVTVRLGMLTPDQIINATLPSRQTLLSSTEAASHRDLWRRLKAENAPFRVVDETGLRSAPITHFDDAILTRLRPEWQMGARVVGEAMVEMIERPFSQCPRDMVVWSRLLALADLGQIELDGPGPSMRDFHVRLAGAP